MKFRFIIFIFVIYLFAAVPLEYGMAEEIETVDSCSMDFQVNIEVPGSKWADGEYIVDRAVTFIVTRIDAPKGGNVTNGFYYFVDNKLKATREAIRLPFQFKQTFRGFFPGKYKLSFMLKDGSGECGVASLPVMVRHEM